MVGQPRVYFEGFLTLGLISVTTEATARGYFREAGFHVPEELQDSVDYAELQ